MLFCMMLMASSVEQLRAFSVHRCISVGWSNLGDSCTCKGLPFTHVQLIMGKQLCSRCSVQNMQEKGRMLFVTVGNWRQQLGNLLGASPVASTPKSPAAHLRSSGDISFQPLKAASCNTVQGLATSAKT